MYVMTYPENPGEEFPSETWLRTPTRGLNQEVMQGEDVVDVDGGGSLPHCEQGLDFRGYRAGFLLLLLLLP